MKKIILMFVLMSTVAVSSHSQIRLGVRAGVNISGVSGDNISDFVDNDLTGFHVGPTVEWLINGSFGLEGAVLYSEKGIKFKDRDKNKNGYLEIPVSVKYRFNVSDTFKPFIDAGPYIGFKISGDDNFDGIKDNISSQWKAKSFSGGLNFGAGVELFSFLQLKAIYGLGLTDNYKASDGSYSVKERTWSASAAVYF